MDIVVSINIYKSKKTLEYQLNTIKEHLNTTYVVIVNCNQYMYDLLSDTTLDNNIYLNPEIIQKSRYHGSLTRGIVSNMKYALDNFDFKYFVVMSGRTIFYRSITIDKFHSYFEKNKWSSLEEKESNIHGEFPFTDWKWPSFKNTKLAKYYMNNNYKLYSQAHEGVCFSYNVTKNIVLFLQNNLEIAEDLYNYNDCVEEFSLNKISSNECNINNLEHGFVYLGNGSGEGYNGNDHDRYMCKIPFLD